MSSGYRAFERFFDGFLKVLPWLFVAGLAIAFAPTGALREWLLLFTLHAALLGWLFLTGVGVAWALLEARHRDRRGEDRADALWIVAWWLLAAVFVVMPLWVAYSIVQRILG